MTDYDTVERRATESRRPMLIVFRDGRRAIDDPVERAVKKAGFSRHHPRVVRATLYRGFEPDRRYVAQFGVERAPAVILVHPDATYHALSGTLNAESLLRFAAETSPPGSDIQRNPFVPRHAQYDWHLTLAGAEEDAHRTGKPMLVAATRLMTRDWQSLNEMLQRPEVYRRFKDMVACRLDVWNPFAKFFNSPWGTIDLPALIVVAPDGTYRILSKPFGVEGIVNFADHRPDELAAAPSDGRSAKSP